MEARPQEIKTERSGLSFPWVFVLMIASFVGGAFVGLHPSWLPIPASMARDPGTDAPADGSQPMLHPIYPGRMTQTDTTQATQPTTQGQ